MGFNRIDPTSEKIPLRFNIAPGNWAVFSPQKENDLLQSIFFLVLGCFREGIYLKWVLYIENIYWYVFSIYKTNGQ